MVAATNLSILIERNITKECPPSSFTGFKGALPTGTLSRDYDMNIFCIQNLNKEASLKGLTEVFLQSQTTEA